ncbi:hypothetical protein EN829_014870 [Mesorhizobium sp. M00.F.Ca.ET.186.01.1.1]|nr:hypothetical protein EN848_14565 [bacterium M00.F.Ca.ET.205.01.1.1]TGU52966.1 hypothetical protein EN795_14830 [bacterium M00.F.Ca.ET.152.01.1.1]TGV35936.1 hypothetical protein EN829_014870 [Mesorhizobium sp. M00.F.Ca.ET.186.01.1.1]TGZ43518.1 hypothetical protein EN805_10440 [bacterium M00.F.Ca.ET.162.01.1.1]
MERLIDEIADLIVEGRNREAYEKLRDWHGDHIGLWSLTFDQRARHLAALKAPPIQPLPSEAEIDARHDRAVSSFEAVVKAKAAATAALSRSGRVAK